MQALVFILMVIFVIVSDRKSKAKKGAAAAAPRAKPAPARARWVRETPPPVVPAEPAPPDIAVGEGEPVWAAESCVPEGDGEGCLGGSLEHDQHEGESRAEHARHLDAVERRLAAEAEAESVARELGALNRRRLRNAVIMAEVLGKPKALSRRTP